MSTIEFRSISEIEEQAAAWIAQIDRGISLIEQSELEVWLAKSAFHGEALIEAASIWDTLDVLKPIAHLMPIHDALKSDFSQTSSTFGIRRSGAMMAAASVMVLVGTMLYLNFPPVTQAPEAHLADIVQESRVFGPQVHRTAIGEMTTVSLPDGSLLELNTDSEVRVSFSPAQRNIELLRGEVYFDVAKDPSKPFVVKVGKDNVTAIGTAFSINAGEPLGDQRSVLEVIVTHGKVRVNTSSSQLPIYLEHGQQAVARDDSFEVSYSTDSESNLAWREGMVVFQGESLTEVVSELNRYTPLKFRLMDQELESISVGGFFKTGNLDQLLVVLESNFGVSSQIINDEIRLSKSQ